MPKKAEINRPIKEELLRRRDFDSVEIQCNGVTWVNIEKPTIDDTKMLAQYYPFHGLHLDDCLSKIQLTKVDEYEDHLFIVLHFPVSSEKPGVVLSNQVSIFLGTNYLVTLPQGELKFLADMFRSCKYEEIQRQALVKEGPGYILYQIIDGIVDGFFPILDMIIDNLEEIEDKVFDEKKEAITEVTRLRREIVTLRRIISPLRRIIKELAKKAQRFAVQDLSIYFNDVNDHIEKVWDTLEECKETIEIFKDTDFMLSTEKANKILAILTIVFTLSIPASIIGTFYGMNINLPGGIGTGSLPLFGSYTTFIIVMTVSLVLASAMLVVFRRYGWF